MKGRYAPLKRSVLEALDAYRKDNGTGCWPALADQAGVATEEIAAIRAHQKVGIDVYQRLEEALKIEIGKD